MRPRVEDLESRLLLYAASGAWSYGQRITFSFVPDGTSVSGVPSTLYQTMTTKTGDPYAWQIQFYKAASVWQQVANINLAWVTDDGSPIGTWGLQQGDTRFGDIRISAIPLTGGTLGAAYMPPPDNYGTMAGDIIMNSTVAWQIGGGFDLETVAIHEFGHALGMDHSQIQTAEMYAYFQGLNQTLSADDIAGIQSIYGPRQYDAFNSGANFNGMPTQPTPLNWFLNSDSQITIPYPLNITKSGQAEYFSVTAPATTTGAMTVIVQAYGLSTLGPAFAVANGSWNTIASVAAPYYGSVAWQTNIPVTAGQNYVIQVYSTAGGAPTGAFGLQINFGSKPLPPVPLFPANVPTQTGTSKGMTLMQQSSGSQELLKIGNLVGAGDALTVAEFGQHGETPYEADSSAPPSTPAAVDWFLMGPLSDHALAPRSSNAVHFVSAAHDVKKAAYPLIRGMDRSTSTWALQSAPSKNFSGKMRSHGGTLI